MRLACMPRMDGVAQAGGEPIGIGIRGLTLSPSFRAMGFSIARSAGVSILRGGRIRLRSSAMAVTGLVDIGTSTITSAKTPITGGPVLTMSEDAITLMASIEGRALREADSIPDQ